MNNKGFTLVELLAVIVLLGLLVGLAVPGIINGSNKSKERTLNTKIKNIEKAAIMYGQDNRNLISKKISDDEYKYCFKDGKLIENCYYYEKDGKTTITVEDLAKGFDGNSYIKFDKEEKIVNPTDESKDLNACEIQIYQKYGKIYAAYDKSDKEDSKCWIN